MKVTKHLLTVSLLGISIISSVYAMPTSEMAIGGVTPGSTYSYVKGIYGEPNRTENISYAQTHQYNAFWGTGFQLKVLSNGKVNTIKTYANNGLGTPAGLTVGQKIQVMYDLYGSPQFTGKYPNGETRHLYKNRLGEIKDSHYMNMSVTEKRGKIIKIECYETYEGGTIPIGVEF